MATTAETLALVEGLARIAAAHRLDKIEVGDVRIARSQHEFVIQKAKTEDEDEILFHSAGAS